MQQQALRFIRQYRFLVPPGKTPLTFPYSTGNHHQYLPDVVQAEPRALTDLDRKTLEQKGHEIKILDRPWGNMHSIALDKKTGKVSAASDPRGEGAAMVK